MRFFYLAFLLPIFFVAFSSKTDAQSNCPGSDTAPVLDCASAILNVCEGDLALFPGLTTTPELPTIEYVVTRVGALASDGLGDEILGSVGTTTINPASFGLLVGEQFDVTPVAYNITQVQNLIDAVYNNSFLAVPCCSWVELASPGFCTNLMAGGINSGADIQDLGDMLALLSVLSGVPGTTASVAGFIASVDNINTQAASLPGSCGAASIPLCYAVPQGTGICRFTILATTAPECNVSLPLELSSFTAEALLLENELKWTTETETNTAYFSIERAYDGVNFLEIGRINAAINSDLPTDYAFSDQNPLIDLNYYRLALAGLDAHISYSEIILVERDDPESFEVVSVGPIPNRGTLTVGISNIEEEDVVFRVIDFTGRVHWQQNQTVAEGLNSYNLNINQLNNGMYILTIFRPQTGIELHAKFIKHHN